MRAYVKISISLLLITWVVLFHPDNVLAQSNNLDSFNTLPVAITSDSPDKPVPSLAEFVESLELNGQENVVGVYAPGLFALRVVQQPLHELAFVSDLPNVLTHFKLASAYGSYGFLAHDHLAGATFFDVEIGQRIFLVEGNGITQSYIITDLLSFQALSPQSPYSQFRSLEFPWDEISIVDLFNRIYAEEDRVILQTCISFHGQPNWGRLFVIATPHSDRYGISGLMKD
jgi:hypothetical protein